MRTLRLLGAVSLCVWLGAGSAAVGGSIIISEIMYNPNSSESDPNDVEWLELYNNGPGVVDVSGWFIQDEDGQTGGLPAATTIGPFEAVVVFPDTQSVADFQAAWGAGYDLYPVSAWAFPTAGGIQNLSNSPSPTNEILTVRDSGGVVIDEANFDDEGDWPSDSPDGPSIYVLPDFLDATSNDNGLNWARSVVGVDGAYGNVVTGDFGGTDVGSPGRLVPVAKGRPTEAARTTVH